MMSVLFFLNAVYHAIRKKVYLSEALWIEALNRPLLKEASAERQVAKQAIILGWVSKSFLKVVMEYNIFRKIVFFDYNILGNCDLFLCFFL